jgi:hypothetical protein
MTLYQASILISILLSLLTYGFLAESRVNFPAEIVKNWLDKLDRTKLSPATWQGKDKKGQPM